MHNVTSQQVITRQISALLPISVVQSRFVIETPEASSGSE